MVEKGFEPLHPKIVVLETTALDHSAIQANVCIIYIQRFLFYTYLYLIYSLITFLLFSDLIKFYSHQV